jgi:hypothetical protein
MAPSTDVETSGILRRIDRLLARRYWLRLPLLFGIGLAGAAAAGAWITPRYLELCRVVTQFATTCREIPPQQIVGYTIAAFGIGMLVLGPIVNTLYRLYRYGQAWETPRGPETAASNVPLAAGVAYIAIGMVIALA